MKINFDLTDKEIEFLKQYAKLYVLERNIDYTTDPIIVVENMVETITQEGYEDKWIYVWENSTYDLLYEMKDDLESNYDADEVSKILSDLEEYNEALDGEIRYIPVKISYEPIAYFLTRKEAEDYCKYQSHNLYNPRVYTRNMGYGNGGDLNYLSKMLLRLGKELEE